MNLAENFQSVFAFADDMIDLFEAGNVALGESFLVGDEEIESGRSQPTGEDAFEEDVGVELLFLSEPVRIEGNVTAMADGDLISRLGRYGVNEIYVAIQPDTIGAGDDVETGGSHLIIGKALGDN